MSEEQFIRANDEFRDIKDILQDSSQLQSEFRLSKEQSDDIDNYVLEIHNQYVAKKSKRRLLYFIPQLISGFFTRLSNIGYLRPAIAFGVLAIIVSTILYFIYYKNTIEIVTNVNDFNREKIPEVPQKLQKDSESAAEYQPKKTVIEKKNIDLAKLKDTIEEFDENEGLSSEHFSLFRTDRDNRNVSIESSGRGKPSAQILERSFDVGLDTLVASKTKEMEQIESEYFNGINFKTDMTAKPLMILSPQNDNLDGDLFFDGKFYKSKWKQLTFQKQTINYKIRSVYKKDDANNYIFLKYEYEKSEKIDKLLDTFELEQTGLNLDSLRRMQEY